MKGIEFFGNLTFLNFPSENGMLTELDVSKNTKLEYLNCEGHLLTSLDVTHNPKLTSLMCGRNYIESLDLSHNPNLKEFNCSETKLSELDISKNTKLESLMIFSTYITSLDLSHNASLEYVCCDLCYIDTLDMSHNPKLIWLSCSQNLLRELDVSKNLSLTYLSCRENRLSNLNVNENINLIELDCNTNAIESLDLSKNVNIESLDVSSNKLSSLDVSKCRSLRTLYCLGNTLKSLSLTENRELELLMAHYTSITSLDLRKCTKIWNKLQDPNLAVSDSFFYYEYSIPGDGVFLTTNLSTDLITDDGLKIDENVFPDPVFLEYVKKNIDKGGDGYLNDSDIAQVKKIDVSGTDVVSLKGIEYFVNLVSLNCEGKKGAGKLISLDVSPFSYLDYLNCANQPIATLNTGNNPILKTLICNDTKISSLDLSNNGNLRSLDIHHTKISSVDLKPCDTIVEKINGGDATFLNRDDYYVFEDAKGNLLLAFDPTTKVIGIDDIPSKPETPTIGDFVERLYTVALGRASEDSGKKYWVDEITSGRKTGGDCGLFFLTGAEFTNRKLSVEDFVETLYQTFFGRESEASGKAYWVGVLKNGGDRNVVVKGFIDSKEWCNLCADYGVRSGAPTAKAERASKNATDFATRLYTCCLGREA
ncbi:MAG: DUF4214 domain-containing protein, partial [Lachnospiraceae bacterium]|nr:DUF4214 domain-containing protein [Lachnospiraceae bacterium]